ncbi:MAG: hypothetical protein AAGD35_10685 [Actinomycetota bacterium]
MDNEQPDPSASATRPSPTRSGRANQSDKAALAFVCVGSLLLFTGLGGFIGFLWAFVNCFADPCGDTGESVFLAATLIGLSVGIGACATIWKTRRWWYRHPAALWLLALGHGWILFEVGGRLLLR